MRSTVRLSILSLFLLVVACTEQGGQSSDSQVETTIVIADVGDASVKSGFNPIDELATQLLRIELATTHVFGLTNTVGTEEYFPSGRSGMPARRDTSDWLSEDAGDGKWIVDTDGEIYEVYDSGKLPKRLWP